MLNGIDISHHNETQVLRGALNITAPDFVIMKATEGRTYHDPKMDFYLSRIDTEKQGYGFYHYARPELNHPSAEADNFIELVGDHAGKALFALDVEGKSFTLSNSALTSWVITWLRFVEEETGVKPLVYTGTEGLLKFGHKIFENDNGLWFARYRAKLSKEMYRPYPFWAIWQFTSTPWDMDKFNGGWNQWNAYCRKR